MALLGLQADTNSVDVVDATVSVRLSASKGDPRGRTAARTHRCMCDTLDRVSYPFCSASFLVKRRSASCHHELLARAGEGLPRPTS